MQEKILVLKTYLDVNKTKQKAQKVKHNLIDKDKKVLTCLRFKISL